MQRFFCPPPPPPHSLSNQEWVSLYWFYWILRKDETWVAPSLRRGRCRGSDQSVIQQTFMEPVVKDVRDGPAMVSALQKFMVWQERSFMTQQCGTWGPGRSFRRVVCDELEGRRGLEGGRSPGAICVLLQTPASPADVVLPCSVGGRNCVLFSTPPPPASPRDHTLPNTGVNRSWKHLAGTPMRSGHWSGRTWWAPGSYCPQSRLRHQAPGTQVTCFMSELNLAHVGEGGSASVYWASLSSSLGGFT